MFSSVIKVPPAMKIPSGLREIWHQDAEIGDLFELHCVTVINEDAICCTTGIKR
jgi:hypothetical protein